jgi:hypothetical protein
MTAAWIYLEGERKAEQLRQPCPSRLLRVETLAQRLGEGRAGITRRAAPFDMEHTWWQAVPAENDATSLA